MSRQIRHLLGFVSCCMLLLLSSAPAFAAINDVGDGSACTLADAIRAANIDNAVGDCKPGQGLDVVRLTDSITLDDRLPAVKTPLRIEGNGHTISAGTQRRIFKVTAGGNLELRHLTLHQGYSSHVPGAALYVEDGTAQLINVKIVDNLNESGRGGAVGIASGSLTCNACKFRSNLGVTGGALWVGRGALATIINSRFDDNSAQNGGAIYVMAA